MAKKIKLSLLGCIGAVEAMAYISGRSAQSKPGSWYQSLSKSSLTPPAITFSIVWPILYVLIGIALYKILQLPKKEKKPLLILFFLQLVLNYLWTPVFFGLENAMGAFVVLVLLFALLTSLILRLLQKEKNIAMILTPYYLWSAFALYLNGYIAL